MSCWTLKLRLVCWEYWPCCAGSTASAYCRAKNLNFAYQNLDFYIVQEESHLLPHWSWRWCESAMGLPLGPVSHLLEIPFSFFNKIRKAITNYRGLRSPLAHECRHRCHSIRQDCEMQNKKPMLWWASTLSKPLERLNKRGVRLLSNQFLLWYELL